MEKWAVIVAGGSGTRMGADMPKQFMLLNNQPVIIHTIKKFSSCHIVLVLPEAQLSYWHQLARPYRSSLSDLKVVVGGDTRTESVMNGLRQVPDGVLVAIHDGVRPLVSTTLIEQSFRQAQEHGSAIAAIDCTDSLRLDLKPIDRQRVMLMQTPQTFRSELIREAYRQLKEKNSAAGTFTDDAMVFEAAGHTPHFIKGERGNIKITLPVDLRIAQALLGDPQSDRAD